MNNVETLRAFIERVKREHKRSILLCAADGCDADFPCDAIRAVLALEELGPAFLDMLASVKGCGPTASIGSINNTYVPQIGIAEVQRWEEALARAAQKIGGGE